ncbi:MAG TPA: serine/threonine-protein kinase [Polyangiaceae bacterium]
MGFAEAPVDSEGARAFLQARVSLLARVELALSAVIQAVATFAYFAMQGQDVAEGADFSVVAHFGVIAVLAAIWLRTRGGRRSNVELVLLDLACVVVPVGFSFVALWPTPPSVRPHTIQVLTTTNLLILRAVLIPGTGQKAVGFGVIFTLAMCAWTVLHHLKHAPGELGSALLLGVPVFAWGVMAGMIIAGVAAHTIFGLRQKVREASQLGQYTLLRRIGEGGMGVVWEARHAFLRRRTAVKLLPAERAGEDAVARFEREVQLTSTLTHPNTISIYDYGRSAEGVFYYAMEYLEGIDLQALVERDGPQPPGVVAHVLAQVCDALSEAHARALIHRDVKPANIFLCERGGVPLVAKVLDFGLVKRLESADAGTSVSVATSVLGTPLYMAPEAVTRPDDVDPRSDLYAVGAVGYFMLTGRPVFDAPTSVEVFAHHLHTPPVPPSTRLRSPVPEDLESLVLECLEKDPKNRPASAAELGLRIGATTAHRAFSREAARIAWMRYSRLIDAAMTPPVEAARLTVELERRA